VHYDQQITAKAENEVEEKGTKGIWKPAGNIGRTEYNKKN